MSVKSHLNWKNMNNYHLGHRYSALQLRESSRWRRTPAAQMTRGILSQLVTNRSWPSCLYAELSVLSNEQIPHCEYQEIGPRYDRNYRRITGTEDRS